MSDAITKAVEVNSYLQALLARTTAAEQRVNELKKRLALYAIHAEYDHPSEVPEFCGWLCAECKEHVREDGSGHHAECPIHGHPPALGRYAPGYTNAQTVDALVEVARQQHREHGADIDRATAAEQRVKELEYGLRSIAEGNLGDASWQANYERIRACAAAALGSQA